MKLRIARWVFLLLLCVGVHNETGTFTTIAVIIIFVYSESSAYMIARWSWVLGMIELLVLGDDE